MKMNFKSLAFVGAAMFALASAPSFAVSDFGFGGAGDALVDVDTDQFIMTEARLNALIAAGATIDGTPQPTGGACSPPGSINSWTITEQVVGPPAGTRTTTCTQTCKRVGRSRPPVYGWTASTCNTVFVPTPPPPPPPTPAPGTPATPGEGVQ